MVSTGARSVWEEIAALPWRRGFPEWPIVRWTRYGRWSDDGARVYASGEHLAKSGREVVIYEAHEARGMLDARRR